MDSILHSIHLCEFDIDEGSTLLASYPSSHEGVSLPCLPDHLAELALPEGAHNSEEDGTFFVVVESHRGTNDEGESRFPLYGVSCCRIVRDGSLRRGARQAAAVALLTKPESYIVEQVLNNAADRYLQFVLEEDSRPYLLEKARSIVEEVYTAVDRGFRSTLQVSLWDMNIAIALQPKQYTEIFSSASLTELVLLFREDVMMLWYGLLLGFRILVVGQPAKLASRLCSSLPLLVHPLASIASLVRPYIPLSSIDEILAMPNCIGGASNPLFEMRSDWYEMAASISQSRVLHNLPFEPTKSDRAFISSVLTGVSSDNRPEFWVRSQFEGFTRSLLDSVRNNTLKSSRKRILGEFHRSRLFLSFLEELEQEDVHESRLDIASVFDSLKHVNDLNVIERSKIVFSLYQSLNHLAHIEEAIDYGLLDVIVSLLSDSSGQVRKYSFLSLSELTQSSRGRVLVLSSQETLRHLLQGLLTERRPNVLQAIAACLFRCTSSYLGSVHVMSEELSSESLPLLIVRLITDESTTDLETRNDLCGILFHLAKFVPESLSHYSPDQDSLKMIWNLIEGSINESFVDSLLLALDVWRSLIPDMIAVRLSQHLSSSIRFTRVHRPSVGNEKSSLDPLSGFDFSSVVPRTSNLEPASFSSKNKYGVADLLALMDHDDLRIRLRNLSSTIFSVERNPALMIRMLGGGFLETLTDRWKRALPGSREFRLECQLLTQALDFFVGIRSAERVADIIVHNLERHIRKIPIAVDALYIMRFCVALARSSDTFCEKMLSEGSQSSFLFVDWAISVVLTCVNDVIFDRIARSALGLLSLLLRYEFRQEGNLEERRVSVAEKVASMLNALLTNSGGLSNENAEECDSCTSITTKSLQETPPADLETRSPKAVVLSHRQSVLGHDHSDSRSRRLTLRLNEVAIEASLSALSLNEDFDPLKAIPSTSYHPSQPRAPLSLELRDAISELVQHMECSEFSQFLLPSVRMQLLLGSSILPASSIEAGGCLLSNTDCGLFG